jgi:hypothetical protein
VESKGLTGTYEGPMNPGTWGQPGRWSGDVNGGEMTEKDWESLRLL